MKAPAPMKKQLSRPAGRPMSSRTSTSSSSSNSRKKQSPRSGGGCGCSLFLLFAWALVLIWILFLLWCWQSGLVDKKRLEKNFKVIVADVENAVVKTEIELIKEAVYLKEVERNMLRGAGQKLNELGVKIAFNGGPIEEPRDDSDIHLVFSTDCGEYQDWQSIVFFHSASVVGQKGRITRIASGCTEEKKKELVELYNKLYPHGLYTAHFTPDFKQDDKSNKSYAFYNKPRGMKHFLENMSPPVPEGVVIGLLDPDMILIRPILTQIRGIDSNIFDTKGAFGVKDSEVFEKVTDGHPAAQTYGLGAPWTNDNHKKFNRGYVCGEGSPCLLPKENYAAQHYSVGPPYLATKSDFIRLVKSWTEFVPRVYESYPYLLAEMYAYSMAAAHESLPHLQLENFMVSNSESGGEGWPWIDALDDVCVPPDENGHFYPGTPLPTVVHYCQRFFADKFTFQKRSMTQHKIFQCDSPMLKEVPPDLGKKEYSVLAKESNMPKTEKQKALQVKRNSYALCIVYRAINAAILDYKSKMCGAGTANFEKTVMS